MSDLIDRQAAIDAHYEYCNKHPDASFPVWSLKILEDLPSAQPEIVRCKDCEYGEQDKAEEPKKCDTCKHVKEPWFERCADCSDYELWESKE